MDSHSNSSQKYRFNKQEILDLLAKQYDIKSPKLTLIKTGLINTSLKVVANKNSFIFRIYQNQATKGQIINELNFQQVLKKRGIPVPKIYTRQDKQLLSTFTDTKAIKRHGVLFEFLPGVHLRSSQHKLIKPIATYHAKMHQIGIKYSKKRPRNNNSVNHMLEWLKTERTNAIKKLGKTDSSIIKLETMYKEVVRDFSGNPNLDTLPAGLCHLDYDSSNILIKNSKVAGIIDFDDLDMVPVCLDLGFSLWWWLYTNPKQIKKIYRSYLTAYAKTRHITKSELKTLPLFIALRNISLAYLLFINIPTSPNRTAINRSVQLHEKIKV